VGKLNPSFTCSFALGNSGSWSREGKERTFLAQIENISGGDLPNKTIPIDVSATVR